MSRPCCLVACCAVVVLAGPARAQDYPSRPVKAMVAVGAGGTGDIFMRVLGEELHRRWGQPVVVENRPGGASNIGARACADAPPDGYTICIMPGEPLVITSPRSSPSPAIVVRPVRHFADYACISAREGAPSPAIGHHLKPRRSAAPVLPQVSQRSNVNAWRRI